MKGMISFDVANLQWSERNARMRRLLQKSFENIQPTSPDPSSHNSPSSLDIEDLTGYSAFTEKDHGPSMFMEFDLLKAATKDDVDGFIDVLERVSTEKQLPVRVILSSVSLSGNTLLHVAASNGNANMVKLLLYHFPSLLTKENHKGDTAMHIAAKAGKASVLWAINHLRKEFSNSMSPIYCGLTDREVDWMEDVSLKVRNGQGNTPLQEALINRHPWVAEQLVKADGKVSYFLNNEKKSSFFLAAEAGYVCCLRYMLEVAAGNGSVYESLEGKSPVHAAVMGRHKEALTILLEKEPKFIHSRDEQGRTSLHCAASIGYLDGVRYLIGKYTPNFIELDDNGLLPIHLAAMKGYVNVIVELLLHYHDPNELLTDDDQNILHIAANYGKYNVVRYVLRTPELKKLINEKDMDGNTPLHLASIQCHAKIVSALTWDERVNLRLINNEGFTALDAAVYHMFQDTISFRKRLTWSALTAAGASRASPGRVPNAAKQASMQSKALDTDKYKDRVNTLLLVSTLVATVTYAAGFTMPGGNSDSGPNEGMATMLNRHTFHIFVLCDTIAMYSAIAVVVTLIWAQLGELSLVAIALRLAIPFLGLALTMMSLAFTAGVYLVVSKLNWLAVAVLVLGLIFIIIVAALFFPLCFPVTSRYRVFRYLTFYLICLATLITGSS